MNGKGNILKQLAGWISQSRARLPAGWSDRIEDTVFVVLDTETTGLDPLQDRILSIGALQLRDGRIRARESEERFLAQEHFDRNTVPIHGILQHSQGPRDSEAEAMRWVQDYVRGSVLVGHHLGFDLKMLQQAFLRQGLPPLENPALDTGLLYRKTLIKSPVLPKKEFYSLDDLARKFDLSCEDRHTALGDAYLTAMAFQHILDKLGDNQPLTLSRLLEMGGLRT